jgi:hypothetical protein
MVAQVMYQLWTTLQARRVQPRDVAWLWTGVGERQLLIVTYDIITSAGVGWRKTMGNGKWHQILVQTHTKSTLRPSRIWTRCSTVKYHETLDTSPERGSSWLSALGQNKAFISDVGPNDLGMYNDTIWCLECFVMIIVLTWLLWKVNVIVSAEGWNKHGLIRNK